MTTRLLGLCGSLRADSWNAALLRAAVELAPSETVVEMADLAPLPLYDPDRDDLMGGNGLPPAVAELRDAVAAADGIIIASPEYNWSYSPVIKNALDWCSRPAFSSVLAGRPALLVGASTGPAGTGRAQLHLRQVLLSTRTPVLLDSVQLAHAGQHIDDGRLHHEPTRHQLQALMAELVDVIARTRKQAQQPTGDLR
jgi:chromate reductase